LEAVVIETMGVGMGGLGPPQDSKHFRKKNYFLSFEWKKTNFTTFAPPRKILEKPTSASPPEKILPTPMVETCNA